MGLGASLELVIYEYTPRVVSIYIEGSGDGNMSRQY